jgi:RNA polymerase sigma factor (sigma-70 family)
MANQSVQPVLRQLHKMLARQAAKDRTDLELLQQFATKRDESSFAALVERHGPLVWNVCHRVLRDRDDAEDAFQATFLVLPRRASFVCKKEAIGSWLYGVAYPTALSQKRAAQRRRRREKQRQIREAGQPASATASLHELQAMLDEEVARLRRKGLTGLPVATFQGKESGTSFGVDGKREGGHGWRGNVYGEIRQGIEWLEKNRENTSGR